MNEESNRSDDSNRQIEKLDKSIRTPHIKDICSDLDQTRQVFALDRKQMDLGANQFLPQMPDDLLSILSQANSQSKQYSDGGMDGGSNQNSTGGMDGGSNQNPTGGMDGGSNQNPTGGMDGGSNQNPTGSMDGGFNQNSTGGMDGGSNQNQTGGMDATAHRSPERNNVGPSAPANPDLHSGDLGRLYERNRERIDLNHDGALSQAELDQAMLNPAIQGEDAQFVSLLRNGYPQFAGMYSDAAAEESQGITGNDIAEYDARQRRGRSALNEANAIETYTNANFERLDRDHNGFLSNHEIDDELNNSSVSPQDRATLRTMRTRSDEIAYSRYDEFGRQNSGMSRDDIQAYVDNVRETRDARAASIVDNEFHQSGERLRRTNHDVFANHANPLESIRPEACRQGSEGDCVLQADLASLAHTNPQAIRDMIHDNGNGTYTVTFPGDPQHPVTVDRPTDSELASFGGGSEYGIWPAIIERAYGVHENRNGNRVPGDVASHAGDSRESASRTMELLTGRPAHDEDIIWMSDERLQGILANSDRTPTTVLMNGNGIDSETGLERGHAYSVVGYDPVTHRVTLRNPWGAGEPGGLGHPRDGVDDGTFTMSFEEFQRTFNRVNH